MSRPLPAPFDKAKVVAENRRARFDYFVEERIEAGLELRAPMTEPSAGSRAAVDAALEHAGLA